MRYFDTGRLLVAALAAFMTASAHAVDGACRASSGTSTTPVIELYTSEGCDSCPPADRWLASQFAPGETGENAIALAFHVDYWDRLGWTDRFAAAAYTERQYDAMRANRANFVYTPQVLLQGRNFDQWRSGTPAAALAAISGVPAHAAVEIEASVDARTHTAEIKAVARPVGANAAKPGVLSVAYTDSALVSEVKAGENRGVRLTHDHVVRALKTVPLAKSGEGTLAARFEPPAEAGTRTTLVAFVQERDSGEILQAVALPLAACAR